MRPAALLSDRNGGLPRAYTHTNVYIHTHTHVHTGTHIPHTLQGCPVGRLPFTCEPQRLDERKRSSLARELVLFKGL